LARVDLSLHIENNLRAASTAEAVFGDWIIVDTTRIMPGEFTVRMVHKNDLMKYLSDKLFNQPPRYFTVKISEAL